MRVFHHLFTSVVLAAWLVFRLLRRRGLPYTPLNPLLYVGVIVWFISALLSLDLRMALENLWFPITNLLLFFVVVDLIQSGREPLLTETILLVSALVVMLSGAQFASWYFGWGFATPAVGWSEVVSPQMPLPLIAPRLFVPVGVSTWLAAFTAPLAVFAAAWALSARRRAARNALWVLAALLMIIMLLTGSRGGWISLAAGGVLLILLAIIQDTRLHRLVRRFALPIAVLAIATSAVGVLMFMRISADPGHSSGDVLRFDLWRGAVDVAADHPFLGVGPGLFGKAYRLVRDPVYVDNRLGTAHNFYLNTLAETGLIGFLVVLGLGVLLLRAWWQLWRSAATPARKLKLAGALAALVGFGAQSFFDTFTSTPLVLLALSLAAYCVTTPRSRIDPPLTGSRPAAFVSLILVLVFALGLSRSDQAQAAFIASLNGSPEQAQHAVALDPTLNLYQLQVAYLTGSASDPAPAVEQYREALRLEPSWDTGWINLAALYVRQDETAPALDALQRAINIDHRNGALLMWAQLAETTTSLPTADILDGYAQALRSGALEILPLSPFWTATDIRRQALEDYAAALPLDLRYRVFAEHDPTLLNALVPENPTTSAEWWVVGEHALTVASDSDAAYDAFSQAIALSPTSGDYYASRARARISDRDLALADLLGTLYESPHAIRASMIDSVEQKIRLLAAAVPPRVIQQNFEGVLFAGRVASFDVLPEMRLPGPGHSVMQPWYDLADLYLSQNDTDGALNVYRAILDRAPDERQAREQLTRLAKDQS